MNVDDFKMSGDEMVVADVTAAFARYYMIDSLQGKTTEQLPSWFNNWQKTGLILWFDDGDGPLFEATDVDFVPELIPAYELQVIENGESVQHMRVVVGRQVSQTPVFSDSIQYVVLNPSWNVPESLALREEFPKIAADPGYLERNGFELVRGFEEEVETVDPYSVDWNDPQALEGLRLRQRPGANNALGRVKLMFPNEFNVYLHDTPATQAFEQTDRDLSHGCVRVEKPLDLAAYVLGRELADVEAEVGTGATRTVRLDEPLPVHILYWTAWVDDRGRVQFRDDVYSVDRRVIEALGEDTEPRVQIASLES